MDPPMGAVAQRALLQLLRVVADSEVAAEDARCRLCEVSGFDPFESFQSLQGSPPGQKGWISANALHVWLAAQPHGLAGALSEEITTMIKPYMNYHGELRYDGFLRLVLPKDSAHHWLKEVTVMRGAQASWTMGEGKMSPEIAYRLCQLLDVEVDLHRHLKFHRRTLRDHFVGPRDVLRFLDREQGPCAGLGGLISPAAVRRLLVDVHEALTPGQCDALLRKINPSGACLAPFDELARIVDPLAAPSRWEVEAPLSPRAAYSAGSPLANGSGDSYFRPKAKKCHICGNTFMPDSNFCRKCGEKRREETSFAGCSPYVPQYGTASFTGSPYTSGESLSFTPAPRSERPFASQLTSSPFPRSSAAQRSSSVPPGGRRSSTPPPPLSRAEPLSPQMSVQRSNSATRSNPGIYTPPKIAWPPRLASSWTPKDRSLDKYLPDDRWSLGHVSTRAPSTADPLSPRTPRTSPLISSATPPAPPPRAASPGPRSASLGYTPRGVTTSYDLPGGSASASHDFGQMPVSPRLAHRGGLKGPAATKAVLSEMVKQARCDAQLEDCKAMLPSTVPLEAIFATIDRFHKGYIADTDLWQFVQDFGTTVTFSSLCALIREVQLRRPRDYKSVSGRLSLRELGMLMLQVGTPEYEELTRVESDDEARSILALLRTSEACPGCGFRVQRDADAAGCPNVSCPVCGSSFRCYKVMGDYASSPEADIISVATQYHVYRLIETGARGAGELEYGRKQLSFMGTYDVLATLSDVFAHIACGRTSFTLSDLRLALFDNAMTPSEQELKMLWRRYSPGGREVAFPDFAHQTRPRTI